MITVKPYVGVTPGIILAKCSDLLAVQSPAADAVPLCRASSASLILVGPEYSRVRLAYRLHKKV